MSDVISLLGIAITEGLPKLEIARTLGCTIQEVRVIVEQQLPHQRIAFERLPVLAKKTG